MDHASNSAECQARPLESGGFAEPALKLLSPAKAKTLFL
jgi:hypothetical protein